MSRSRFTSYHLRSGQLFYAKTGRAVPESMIGRMHIKGDTVYRDGRKSGQLRQKGITPKALEKVKENVKHGGTRVKRVKSGGITHKPPVYGPGPLGTPEEGVPPSIDPIKGLTNFISAVDDLVSLKIITKDAGLSLVEEYTAGDDSQRSFLWEYIHSLFGDKGYIYESP